MDCPTVRHGPTVIHMASTPSGDYDYQRYLAMSIKAETAARGWSLAELADRSGIDYQTLLRKLNLKRHLSMDELDQIAAALDLRPSDLAADAESRRDKGPRIPGDPGIHPEDAKLIESSDKLTKRQRAQAKSALQGETTDFTQMSHMRTGGESLGSSERRPRRAGNG